MITGYKSHTVHEVLWVYFPTSHSGLLSKLPNFQLLTYKEVDAIIYAKVLILLLYNLKSFNIYMTLKKLSWFFMFNFKN